MFNTKTARIAAIVAASGVVLFGATTASAGGSPTIPDGSVWQSDIAKPVNDLYLKDDLGKGKVVEATSAHRIDKIGGSFNANRTQIGGFNLASGTWLITTSATFTRTERAPKGAPKTRPSLSLRYGSGDGASAGTIAGVDISPAKGGELLGSAVQTVTITDGNMVMIWGHGVNDDGSDFASGQITVAAQVTATRIG